MNNYNKFITFFIVIVLSACSSYEAQYKGVQDAIDTSKNKEVPIKEDPTIETSVYLIGDAGDAEFW